MIILEKPYVSEFLIRTLEDEGIPVLDNAMAREMGGGDSFCMQTKDQAVRDYKNGRWDLLYTNSENAIQWISENLAFTPFPDWINTFKDKVRFRELIRPLFPNYFFREIKRAELGDLDKEELSYPLIFKPAVGFFSMGVYKLYAPEDWLTIEEQLQKEFAETGHLYPPEVFDGSTFIIESLIEGREFAMDAYYDENGEAVILNIMEHFFSSDADVSDRLYSSSPELINEFIVPFQDLLNKIGQLIGIKNFPIHMEVRVTPHGEIIPIEGNPLRFGGWCTTADLAGLAYGINPYACYFNKEKPNWPEILNSTKGKSFHILILDNSSGYAADQIESFDSEAILSLFPKVLDFRPVDFNIYPLFGFIYLETPTSQTQNIQKILKSNLQEFITLKPK